MWPNHTVLFFLIILFTISCFKLSYCTSIGNINGGNINLVCPEIEKEALLSFKESLEDPYNMLSSWNTSADVNCCNWKGVVCSNITGGSHVHQLRLQSYNQFSGLRGKINPSLLNLKHLKYLDLSQNEFEETIPSFIGSITSLEYLDLSHVGFYGTIPNFSNTTKLQHIDLSFNNFNSTIPDWLYSLKDLEFLDLSNNYLQGPLSSDIANLTSLSTLDLSKNQLSGKIPRGITANLCKMQKLYLFYNNFKGDLSYSFGNMSDCFLGSLEHLVLTDNQFSGQLTSQFGEFKSLETLYLGSNSLSGAIPINLGKLSFLETLSLADNKLTGNLPESMGQLCNLESISIRNNKLEGVVSEIHFANLTKLNDLNAYGNHLTLNISPNWIPPFKVRVLQLGSWDLGEGGQIPTWIEKQKLNIISLDLSSTGISGIVPSWIWKIPGLDLSHNQLHGNIPFISDTTSIDLSSNRFTGSLPQVAAGVRDIDLSNNSFSGGLSHFLCNMNQTYSSLNFLHLGGNQLSGEIPDCWVKWPSMKYLNLGNNMLSGIIPNSIGFLTGLRSLNLYNNTISGRIPFSMSNCTTLVKIDLGNNDLDGSIPSWIGTSIANLKILILRSNKLSGKISSDICHLNSLQILDISDNMFSGIIPRCVDNFTAMATKRSLSEYGIYAYLNGFFWDSATVATKGSELEYDNILELVTNIDLSNNNLSGGIPKELTSLVQLRSLNLSKNHFTGLIPQSIGDMNQIESLDLSRNSLSGEMPNSFRGMSTLNYLNVSYNHLTGRIPESTQIRGFNASSFIGNDDLCGPPLTSNCSSSDGPKNREDNYEKGDRSSSKIEWLYVFVSLGYAVGLSVFCTTLVLNKSWREAYYAFMEEMWNKVYVYFYLKWKKLTKTSG